MRKRKIAWIQFNLTFMGINGFLHVLQLVKTDRYFAFIWLSCDLIQTDNILCFSKALRA